MRMRSWLLLALSLVAGCSSNGSQVQTGTDSGTDATTGDAEADVTDGGQTGTEAQADAPPACSTLTVNAPAASNDCIYLGSCPENCIMGTASGYACRAGSVPAPDGGAYPSTFDTPLGIVSIIGTEDAGYPWDASAYVVCAPLACVRWSTADHLEGGSAWPSDPCGTVDAGPYAWVCPPFPGVLPSTDAGCASAGDMNDIGGAGAGVPSQTVWCCAGTPGVVPPGDGGPGDAAAAEGGDAAEADASGD